MSWLFVQISLLIYIIYAYFVCELAKSRAGVVLLISCFCMKWFQWSNREILLLVRLKSSIMCLQYLILWKRISYAIRGLIKLVFVGHSKAPFPSIPEKEKNAWKLPNNTSAFYTSTDASLFSSSLPVLPHVKCEQEQLFS